VTAAAVGVPYVVVTTWRRTGPEGGPVVHVWGPYSDRAAAVEARDAMRAAAPAGHFRNPDGRLVVRIHQLQAPELFYARTPTEETA